MLDPTLLLLASLADGEKHGYAMMIDIEAFAGIRLGAGTLYGAITRAEQRGLIEPAWPRTLAFLREHLAKSPPIALRVNTWGQRGRVAREVSSPIGSRS